MVAIRIQASSRDHKLHDHTSKSLALKVTEFLLFGSADNKDIPAQHYSDPLPHKKNKIPIYRFHAFM